MEKRLSERWMFLGGALLLGCPPPQPAAPKTELPPLTANLLQISVNREGQQSTLSPLEPAAGLRAKESFTVGVETNLPSYLYVVREGGRGVVQLHPGAGDQSPLVPAGQTRLPGSAGAWLNTGELDSTDLLCVMVSRQALERADLTCRDPGRDEDRPTPPPQRTDERSPPPPPPPKDTRKPELFRVLQLPLQRD